MGAQSSTVETYGIVSQYKLIPQTNFEATIHKRFVRNTTTTLELEDQFWNKPHDYDLEIRDVATGRVVFKVPPPKPESPTTAQRRVLLDAYGVPVVGMEQHAIEPPQAKEAAWAVIPGGFAATNELFRFETRFNPFDYRLQLAFHDYKDSPDRVRVVVFGQNEWLARQGAIAIQRDGEHGNLYMIARQVPVGDIRDGTYRLEIAAGVDLALMVLIAAAMDEMSHKYITFADRHTMKRQVESFHKAEKKAQKQQRKAASREGQPVTEGAGTSTSSA